MSIMRALKNVGIGYLQGTTDIMAQKAAQKREDEKLAAEREYELKLQKDRILQTKLANIEVNNEKFKNESNLATQKEQEDLKNRRNNLLAQGYTVPMVDVLTEQGYLKSDAAFGIFFNKYNRAMFDLTGNPDWHTALDSNGVSFQDLYVQSYQAMDTENVGMDSSSILQSYNNMSKNTADSQLEDFKPKVEDTTTPNYEAASGVTQTQNILDLPAGSPAEAFSETIRTDIANQVPETQVETPPLQEGESFKPIKSSRGFLSTFSKPQLQKEIHIVGQDHPAWALTDVPREALKEGEAVKLTLSADGTGYTSKIVKLADNYQDLLTKTEQRDKTIVDAIKANGNLFNESEDIAQFLKGGKQIEEYFAQNAQKQKLFVNVYDYASLLDTSYRAAQVNPEFTKPQQIVQNAIRLNNSVGMDAASDYAVAVANAQAQGLPVSAQADILLNGVNNVIRQVNAATVGIDRGTEEGQALIARIQAKALNEFKINVSFATLPENERSSPLAKGDANTVQLVDLIIADIQKGAQGNKGKFYITGGKAKAQRAQETLFTTGSIDAVPTGEEITDPDKKPPPKTVKFDFTGVPERTVKSGGGITTNPEYEEYFNNFTQEKFDSFDKEFEDLKAKEPKKRIPNPPKIVGDKEIKMSGTRINPEWSKWNESVKPYRDLYQKLLNYELQNKDKIKYTTQKTK